MSKSEGSERKMVEVEDTQLPDIIQWEETPECEGTLKGFLDLTLERKKVEVALFENDGAVFGVWVSSGLTTLKDFQTGTFIHIRTLGMEKMKKKTGYWRKFKISFDPETGGYIQKEG